VQLRSKQRNRVSNSARAFQTTQERSKQRNTYFILYINNSQMFEKHPLSIKPIFAQIYASASQNAYKKSRLETLETAFFRKYYNLW
jgi:hypothetical protein